MKRWKKWMAMVLTVVTLMGTLPGLALPAAAAGAADSEKLNVTTAAVGKYTGSKPGGITFAPIVMNGALKNNGAYPTDLPIKTWDASEMCKDDGNADVGEKHDIIDPGGSVSFAVDDASRSGMGSTIADYNMMSLFGVGKSEKKENWRFGQGMPVEFRYSRAPAVGFYTGSYYCKSSAMNNPVVSELYKLVNCNSSTEDARDEEKDNYSITIGMAAAHDEDVYKDSRRDFWGDIAINDNPTLKALAESGSLYFRFSSLVLGAKECVRAASDDYTDVSSYVLVYHNDAGKTGDEGRWFDPVDVRKNAYRYQGDADLVGFSNCTTLDRCTKSIDTNWVRLQPGDVIRLEISVDRKDDNNEEANVGFSQSVLLFADCASPKIDGTITVEANGAYNYNGSTGNDEVLLRKNSSFALDVTFNKNVKSFLPVYPDKPTDDYHLLTQLSQYKLFTTPLSTGAARSGQAVFMNLTALPTVKEIKDKASLRTISDAKTPDQLAQVNGLLGAFGGLHYEWQAQNGDYNNGNPILPNDLFGITNGDTTLKNNTYSLFERIAMASLHDLAGNPLLGADNKPISTKKEDGSDKNDGYLNVIDHADVRIYAMTDDGQRTTSKPIKDIGYHSSTNFRDFKNPFEELDFKIDAISPTYSVTSNGIQPSILTDLALNKGDGFDLTVKFSEPVMVKRYDSEGKVTGWQQSGTYLTLNNGLKATYYSGDNTREWVFHTNVDGSTESEIGTLDVLSLNHSSAAAQDTYVLTDEVGNPVLNTTAAVVGSDNATQQNSIAWSKLKVDNTVPTITIVDDDDGHYVITATDANLATGEPGSGIFQPGNASAQLASGGKELPTATGEGSQEATGLVYYAWIHGDADTVQAQINELISKNKYAEVKKYSLSGTQPSTGFELHALNNGSAIGYGEEGDTLVVFASDMTWDSARQLIQYSLKSATTEEEAQDYLGEVAKALLEAKPGLKELTGDAYVVLTDGTAPADWSTNYTDYYEEKSGGWAHITENPTYPVFKTGTFYLPTYTKLDSKPDDWDTTYTDYYTKSGDDYVAVTAVPEWPAFETDTYYKYVDYALSEATVEPGNFATDMFRKVAVEKAEGQVTKTYEYLPIRTAAAAEEFCTGKTYRADDYFLAWTVTDAAMPTEQQKTNQIVPQSDYQAELRLLKKLDSKPADLGTEAGFGKYYILADSTERNTDSEFSFITDQYVSLERRYDVNQSGQVVYVEAEPAEADRRTYYESYKVVKLSGASGAGEINAEDVYANVYRREQNTMSDDAVVDSFIKVETDISGISNIQKLPVSALGGAVPLCYVELAASPEASKPGTWATDYANYVFVNDAEDITYTKNTSTVYDPDKTYFRLDPNTGSMTSAPDFSVPEDVTVDQQADWDAYATKYYYTCTENTGWVYRLNVNEIFTENKYYKKTGESTYELLTEQPEDWETNFNTSYYAYREDVKTIPGARLDRVGLIPKDVYKPNTYYKYVGDYVLLTEAPRDWTIVTGSETVNDVLCSRYGYEDYFIKTSSTPTYENVPRQTPPAFETNKYYKWEYVALTSQPDDWKTGFKSYAVKKSGSEMFYYLSMIDLKQWENEGELEFTSDPVTYQANKYAKANDQVNILAESIENEERKTEFVEAMTAAANCKERIAVLQGYSEFAEAISEAEKWLLKKAGNYAEWHDSYYKKADSNWTYAIQSPLDTNPPAVSFGEAIGSGTSNVRVEVTVTDMTDPLTVKYAFIQKVPGLADSEQPEPDFSSMTMKDVPDADIDDDASLYTLRTPSDGANAGVLWQYDTATSTFSAVPDGEATGDFVLWIYAEDGVGKPGHSQLVAYTQDEESDDPLPTYLQISQKNSMITTPYAGDAGKADRYFCSGEQVTGVTAVASGSSENTFLVEKKGLKAWYAICRSTEPAPTEDASWTLLTDGVLDEEEMTFTYQIPAFTKTETGKYIVYVKSTWDGGGATAAQASENIKFDCDVPLVTFNQVTNTQERAAFTVTGQDDETNGVVSGIDTIEYQWSTGAPEKDVWITLTAGQVLDCDLTKMETVTLYIRATDKAGNVTLAQRVCGKKIQPVAAPTPTGELLAVEELDGSKYAVVELSLGADKQPERGADYSYTVTAAGGEDSWSRWMPYESIVRVNVGEDTAGKTLKLKFRSSSGAISAAEKTVVISDFTNVNDEPYAAVIRSTLNRARTVGLTFLPKAGCTVEDVTDNQTTLNASGVFSYVVKDGALNEKTLTVAVDNITTEPPEYDYRFSVSEPTNLDVQLTMINMAEDVSVKSVGFTPVGGEKQELKAAKTVTVGENGTLEVTLVDTAGNEVTFYPTITWIDKSKPEVSASVIYEYQDGTETVKCTQSGPVADAAFIELTATDGKSFTVNRASDAMTPEYTAEDGRTVIYRVTENRDDYCFTVANALGTTDVVTTAVDTIVAIPTIHETGREVKNGKVEVTFAGTVDTARGQTVTCDGKPVQVNGNTFTYTESYGANGKYRIVLRDQLMQQVLLPVEVAGLDDVKPTLTFNGGIMMTVNSNVQTVLQTAVSGGQVVAADSRRTLSGEIEEYATTFQYLTSIDETVAEGKLGLFLGTLPSLGQTLFNSGATGSRQAYLIAKDAAGNQTKVIVYVAVMPSMDNMIVTADGILVDASSSVVPIIEDDTVTIQVHGFKYMKYGRNNVIVENDAGTYDMFIQKGLYREGNIKTLHSIYLKRNQIDTITFSPTAADPMYRLDGSGWYTIIVRNAERETQYTTFFVSAETQTN